MRIAVLLCCGALFAQEPEKQTPENQTPEKRTIVVTGSYQAIPLEEADRSVIAIPARELAPLAGSIGDLLNLDASVDLRERAPGAINSGLSIRGGSFGQSLILWNGLRLSSVQTSNLSMDLPIPLESIAQIEILKGSGSTLYGSDATAGVLNVISKPPALSEVRFRSGFGNWGTQQQHASAAYVTKLFSQHLTLARDFSRGFMANRDYRNLSVASQTQVRQTEVTLALNDRPYGAEQFYGNFNSWERTKGWFAGVKQGLGKKTDLLVAYRRNTDLFVLYRDRPQVFTNRHIVETWQASLRRSENLPWNARLHYGAEFLGDRIVSNNLGQHSRARSAVYAAYDIRALKRFSLTIGLRDEIYRNLQQQFNPSAGVGYWLTQRAKLRASASRAFRLPTYTDLYYRDPGNVGNPLLRPEHASTYEGGLDLSLPKESKLAMTVFQRREKDGIDFVRRSPTDIWRATNFQALNFTGFESQFTVVVLKKHRIELSYTGLNGAQTVLAGQQSKYVFNYPRHSGVATWQAAWNNGLFARTRIGAIERLGRTPYAVWDTFVSFQKGRVRPYLQLANITSTRYEELIGVRMPGRSFVGGLELVLYRPR